MWWFLLFCGLLYGAFCCLWDFALDYWWAFLIAAVVILLIRKQKKDEKQRAESKAKAAAEFEQIVPVDPVFTALGAPIETNRSEEEKNAALDEINLLMWAARAVSEYHTIDELRNPVSDASTKRDQRCIFADDMAVVAAIYRTCKISYSQGAAMIPKLVELNFLIPTKNGHGYTARLTANEFERFYKYHENNLRVAQGLEPLHDLDWFNDGFVEDTAVNMDSLTGEEFEVFCADILAANGFSDIQLTKRSGDHGVDIVAKKDGVVYAIQCKRYSSSVGNTAVQEAYSGKGLYNADVAVIMTNSYFTKQAVEDANRLRVRLWDRDKLLSMQ